MDRKAKLGFSALGIVCLVFGILGTVYSVLGFVIHAYPQDGDDATVAVIFGCLGICFLGAALIMLAVLLHRQAMANRLLREGRYVWGEVVDITANYSVRVNSRHPYVLLVRYQDAKGQIHIFRSANIYRYPDKSVLGRQVKVFHDGENFKRYYIDIEDLLPQVIEH